MLITPGIEPWQNDPLGPFDKKYLNLTRIPTRPRLVRNQLGRDSIANPGIPDNYPGLGVWSGGLFSLGSGNQGYLRRISELFLAHTG